MATPSTTALVLMDLQQEVVPRYDGDQVVENAVEAVKAAQAAGVRVIYVTVAFRPGFPEISPNNKTFGPLRQMEHPPAGQLDPRLELGAGDVLVNKKRIGAFAGSDLETILRSQAIDHLVLGGITTSGVVLSTVRLAADLDYRITVLADCCTDRDADVHAILIGKVFPSQAEVVTCADWAAGLKAIA